MTDVFPHPLSGYRVYPGDLTRSPALHGHPVALLARRVVEALRWDRRIRDVLALYWEEPWAASAA